jgi:hypothetical protein
LRQISENKVLSIAGNPVVPKAVVLTGPDETEDKRTGHQQAE